MPRSILVLNNSGLKSFKNYHGFLFYFHKNSYAVLNVTGIITFLYFKQKIHQ